MCDIGARQMGVLENFAWSPPPATATNTTRDNSLTRKAHAVACCRKLYVELRRDGDGGSYCFEFLNFLF